MPNTFGFYPTCVEQRHVRCLDDGREGLKPKIPLAAILLGIQLVGPRTEANAKRKCRGWFLLDFSLRGCPLMGASLHTTVWATIHCAGCDQPARFYAPLSCRSFGVAT